MRPSLALLAAAAGSVFQEARAQRYSSTYADGRLRAVEETFKEYRNVPASDTSCPPATVAPSFSVTQTSNGYDDDDVLFCFSGSCATGQPALVEEVCAQYGNDASSMDIGISELGNGQYRITYFAGTSSCQGTPLLQEGPMGSCSGYEGPEGPVTVYIRIADVERDDDDGGGAGWAGAAGPAVLGCCFFIACCYLMRTMKMDRTEHPHLARPAAVEMVPMGQISPTAAAVGAPNPWIQSPGQAGPGASGQTTSGVMQVVLPPNVAPGSVLSVQAPDGRVVNVTVPAGALGGTAIMVSM